MIRRLLFLLTLALCASFCACAEGGVYISEVMASNGVYLNGEAHDWLEITNASGAAVDVSGWYLSDKKSEPRKWSFPEGATLKPGAYAQVFCTGEARDKGKKGVYYADFKVSASGETLYLSDADGALVDSLSLPAQYGCVSYGVPASGGAPGFFETATPGKPNANEAYQARAAAPMLSVPAGFYDDALTLSLLAEDGAEIRYTLDGSEPTRGSALFAAPLDIVKTAVVRAKAFAPGLLPSADIAATYFIGDASPAPVVSLITDEKYLFDGKTGALVKGTGGSSTPNYEQEWEYPVHIEYFDEAGAALISQRGTFTAAGHSARQNKQKSIALYARKAYGEDRFFFNPFPNRDYDSYKSLLLRSANSDAFSTRLRDPFISSLAEGLNLLYQNALPIVVYINGEYWGHYNLREKINKHFIAQWEGVTDENDIDNIDILARTGIDDYVQNGDNADWLALIDFCKKNDLNQPENLAYVEERLDIDSLFTHTIFEMIIGNTDMTNVRMYRVPGGKWKYLLFDVEAGFMSTDEIPISYYIKSVTAKTARFQHAHLAALLNVPAMREKFLLRFAEILESHFQWSTVEAKLMPWEAALETLLPRHCERWGNFTVAKFRNNVNAVRYYARVRPKTVIDQVSKAMKLTKAEKETYFGAVADLLSVTNAAPE